MNTALCAAMDDAMDLFYQTHPECFHPFLMKEREEIFSCHPNLAEADRNTFALFSEILGIRVGFDRNDAPQKTYYAYICHQIYCFFRAKGYEEEHYTAVALKEMLITVTAIEIIQWTNWNAALVTAGVTLLVSSTIKIGVRAWCQYYEDTHPEVK